MKESEFNKKIVELCGDNPEAQYKYLQKFNKKILQQTGDENRWKLFDPLHTNPEDGIYLVLQCGYNGIYQTYNFWSRERRDWEVKSTDHSSVIMYKDIEFCL